MRQLAATAAQGGLIHISSQLLAMISAVFLPIVTGLVTKEKAPAWLKAGVLALLAAIGGAVTTAITAGGVVNWQVYLFNILLTWITAVATYYGYWQHAVLPRINAATADFGIGGPAPIVAVSTPVPAAVTATPPN